MGGLTSSALCALARKLDQLIALHLGAGGRIDDAPRVACVHTFARPMATVRTGDACIELEFAQGEWRIAV